MVTGGQLVGIVPAFFIAVFGWVYSIFILNRFRGFRNFSRIELISLALFMVGAYAAWIAELCILDDGLVTLQLASSLYRTFVNWFGFLLIVNERLSVSLQQIGSLVFVIIIAVLWELQHRVMLNSSDEDGNATIV